MAEKDMVDLRLVLAVIRRWAWLVIGCAVLAMVLALGVTARMRPVYKATATLLVAPAGQSSNTSEYNTLRAGQ